MSVVVNLNLKESVRLDRSQFETLYVRLGPATAEKEINVTLEELAISLSHIQKSHKNGKSEDVHDHVRHLTKVANKLGMTCLGRVARDVLELSRNCDFVAYEATLARLGRIGERSLIAVWDIQDMSI